MLACPKYRRQKKDREGGRESGGERVKRDAHLGFELSFELRFRVCRIDPALSCPINGSQSLSVLRLSPPTLLLPHPPSGKWQLTMRMLRMEMESEIVNRRCLCSFHGAIALRFVYTKIYRSEFLQLRQLSWQILQNFFKYFRLFLCFELCSSFQ